MFDIVDFYLRFGNPAYFEYSFISVDRKGSNSDPWDEFMKVPKREGQRDRYEVSRQQFLKLLGQHRMVWHSTNKEIDLDVEVSRIYRKDRHEFLAFMRIQPRGFRGERVVPAGLEMEFHLLIGSVVFNSERTSRTMFRGHVIVKEKASYSIRCLNEDQPAYLIFKIKKIERNSTNNENR